MLAKFNFKAISHGSCIRQFSNLKAKVVVPREGIEPSSREALVPKTSVSTNFTTWALNYCIRNPLKNKNKFILQLILEFFIFISYFSVL